MGEALKLKPSASGGASAAREVHARDVKMATRRSSIADLICNSISNRSWIYSFGLVCVFPTQNGSNEDVWSFSEGFYIYRSYLSSGALLR